MGGSKGKIIGLDLDNTIVSYEKPLAKLLNQVPNIPSNVDRTKIGIRDYLRKMDREHEWTILQGSLYGPEMMLAEPYPDAIKVINELHRYGFELHIISHRTRYPYAGEKYNLHVAASNWIKKWIDSDRSAIRTISFFEDKVEKIRAIESRGCNFFVDDLPEILISCCQDNGLVRILFDPEAKHKDEETYTSARSWSEIACIVNGVWNE